MHEEPDYYSILGVDPSVSSEELRQRHKLLVRELHPDTHGGDPALQERLTLVNVAFHELRDDLRRSAYDRRRRESSRIGFLDLNTVTEEDYVPRPVRRTFRTGYGTYSSRNRSHNRRAVLGALLATGIACLLVLGFLFISNDNALSNSPTYTVHSAAAEPESPQDMAAQDLQKITNLQVEDDYQDQYSRLLSAGQVTLMKVNDTASILENNGNTLSAGVLRKNAEAFQSDLRNVSGAVQLLGQSDSNGDEQKLEDKVSKDFAELKSANLKLSREEQDMKANDMVSGSDFSDSGNSLKPIRDSNSSSTSATIP